MPFRDAYRAVVTSIAAEVGRLRRLPLFGGRPTGIIIAAFRSAGAVNRRTAQRFHAKSRVEAMTFQWLLDLEILREPEPGRYFLDEDRLAALNTTRFFE
jgi:hypothetical protein